MMLNPSEVLFDSTNKLINRPESSWMSKLATAKIPNEIFFGVLKLGGFHYGCTPGIDIEVVRGPVHLIGKRADVKLEYLEEAMKNQTLLSDAQGYYIEGQWVFVKRGKIVRLNKYKT